MDNITVAGFVAGILSITLFALKEIVNIIVKRWQARSETQTQAERLEIERQESDEKLDYNARTFMDEAARESITTLQNLTERYHEELNELRKDNIRLIETTSQLKSDIALYKERFDRLSSDVDQSNKRQQNTQRILEDTQTALRESGYIISDMQKQIGSLQSEVNQLRNAERVLKENHANDTLLIKDLKSRLIAAKEDLDKKNLIIAELNKRVNAYKAQLELVKKHYEESIKKNNEDKN